MLGPMALEERREALFATIPEAYSHRLHLLGTLGGSAVAMVGAVLALRDHLARALDHPAMLLFMNAGEWWNHRFSCTAAYRF
jgi:hypothetical protein